MTDPAAQPWTETRLVVADVEGNGARPPGLVELALVPLVGGVVGEPVTWLVRPDVRISWQATKVHGITNDDVASLPPLRAVQQEIRAHLGESVLVAHNAHVDVDVLTRELPGWQPAGVIDTLKLSRRVHPERPSHRLGALVEAYDLAEDLPNGMRPHRADYDALVTARLLLRLAAEGGWTTLADLTDATRTPPQPEPESLF